VTELEELAELEAKAPVALGAVGYKFHKQFPDGQWYAGVVTEILRAGTSLMVCSSSVVISWNQFYSLGFLFFILEDGKDRRCHYPEDNDFEDLSMADLQRLAALESGEGKVDDEGVNSEARPVKKKYIRKSGKMCGSCKACLRDDCGQCTHCLDKPKFGGKNKIKQKCEKRTCLNVEKDKKDGAVEEVQHNDLCETCGEAGELLCCSSCNLVFHLGCTRPKLEQVPDDDWSCPFCVASGEIKNTSKKELLRARVAVKEIESLKKEAEKKEGSRRKSSRIRNTVV